jgi:transcription antitermination protein NusB
MRSLKDPRHIARVVAVMDLYRDFFPEEKNDTDRVGNNIDIDSVDFDELDLGDFSTKLCDHLIKGVRENHKEIDQLIDIHSDPIKSSDLDTLILQIIRVAVFEGFIARTVPPKVAVDEAIELTRDFGQEMSSKKVSGILGKIFDKVKKAEDN